MCIESSWPAYDESLIESEEFELIIQINGKVRGKIKVNKQIEENTIEDLASKVDNVKSYLENKEIKKVIFVKNKLINFVI